jgi:predicted RNA-binding protein with PIN domain
MLGGAVQEPIALVDARNVIRSRWPNLREEWFLERTRAWAEREGVRAQVVFDGRAPDWEDDERVTVGGTGRRIADDVIAEEAARLAGEGCRVWVVTSDRGLRVRVRPHAERTIGGGTFAGVLERLPP